jgi:hypothetical protein
MITHEEFYRQQEEEMERAATNEHGMRGTVDGTPSVEEEENAMSNDVSASVANLTVTSTQVQNDYSTEVEKFSAQQKKSIPVLTEDHEEEVSDQEEAQNLSEESIPVTNSQSKVTSDEMDPKKNDAYAQKKKERYKRPKNKSISEYSSTTSWDIDPEEEEGMRKEFIIGISIAVVITVVNIIICYVWCSACCSGKLCV